MPVSLLHALSAERFDEPLMVHRGSTPSADVGPISSTFKASAAWRIAREARSRTDGGTSGPETSSRRVAIASEARDRTSARSRSLRNDLARFNPAMNSGSSPQPFGHGLRLATRHVGPVGLGPGQDVDGPEPGGRQAGFRFAHDRVSATLT